MWSLQAKRGAGWVRETHHGAPIMTGDPDEAMRIDDHDQAEALAADLGHDRIDLRVIESTGPQRHSGDPSWHMFLPGPDPE